MNKTLTYYLQAGVITVSLLSFAACSKKITTFIPAIPIETGVSQTLAEHRAQVLSQVAYKIDLDIPAHKAAPIQANETIGFNLKDKTQPLQIDFKEQPDHLQKVWVNGKEVAIVHTKEHLIISPEQLKDGENEVKIQFIAGDLSLNRNENYLYTLLVPDRARTVFPCFDQPNLKATYQLSLTIPEDWKAIANAPLQDSVVAGQRKTYHYANSDTISTYLFSFAAGEFNAVTREINGRTMRFLHRETDPKKLAHSLEPIFQLHADALSFMEEYTGIPYPFQKFDFVAIPDFQYGGMEHVGAIQYKASSLFLDEGATKDQEVSRANLIAHETAHMWFGDLVTMKWFNDVWTKEVFANFMADKASKEAGVASNYDLKFLIDHFPAAYGVDRTAGANPIRQPLDNLQDAGTLYGSIIYHKAPIMMRQLERLMGEKAFRAGLQQYLKTYAFANATWPNLIEILDKRTEADLQAWNKVWVNEPGRPTFKYELDTEGNQITNFTITQQAEDGSDRLWPQLFEVALVYKDHVEELTINMDEKQVNVSEAVGKEKPLFVLFNSSGQGYGQFPINLKGSALISTLQDPVMRASAYINQYESMLNGKDISPDALLLNTLTEAAREPEELNLKLLTGQLNEVYWKFIPTMYRDSIAEVVEEKLWQAMQQREAANEKKLLFKAYQNVTLSQKAQDRLYKIWESQQAPEGVKLSEDDYISLALALAVRDYKSDILEKQLTRIKNPDRQKRLQFIMPALSADVAVRDAFFASLSKQENREKEAWVASALSYLHHPLRAETSEKYLQESLELLEEIQLTGDIFFPTNWLMATFSSYRSPGAAKTVRNFLEHHPSYNPKLKGKILQAADDVFRAEKLLQQ